MLDSPLTAEPEGASPRAGWDLTTVPPAGDADCAEQLAELASAVADMVGWLASLIIAMLLFPSVALMAVSLLLEDIARAVETRHYPGLPPPRAPGIGEQCNAALRLALRPSSGLG